MYKKFNLAKIFILIFIFLFLPSSAMASSNDTINMPEKNGISTTKPWTVKFSMSLDASTVNEKNVTVKDKEDKQIQVHVTIGEDGKSIVIDPPVGGYVPKSEYYLNISNKVKSKSGEYLDKSIKMKFTTSVQLEDTTNYPKLPVIKDLNIYDTPILEKRTIIMGIKTEYDGDVQYRIFIAKYPKETYDNMHKYPEQEYKELTKGYTKSRDAERLYGFFLNQGLEAGKYKVMIYVKRAEEEGMHSDKNSDYDNYYTAYFKVLEKSILKEKDANIERTEQNIKIETAAFNQYNRTPYYSESDNWARASQNLIEYYMNPYNFVDDYGKYQFLKLTYMEGVTASDLNKILKGKGILEGKGQTFLQASKKANINPIYLVAHALLETGNGTSTLANGIKVSTVNGKKVTPKITYNFFGVHAYDDNPNKCGSEFAYEQKWFTVDDAINGGAKYIGSSYINNKEFKQDTLYKMRWNNDTIWHQYATDIGWARKQVSNIKKLIEMCKNAKPVFDIPIYK